MNKYYRKILIMLFSNAFALLFYNKSIGQTTKTIQLLKQKFLSADSVVLISHKLTAEYGPKEVPDWEIRDTSMNLKKWKELHPDPPPFLTNGKLNKQIIRESICLNDSSKVRLVKILLRQVNLNRWTPLKCDQPQHSIIFFKDNLQSFIDICFGCKRIHSSKDIAFDEMNVDERKWNELIAFFKLNGLTKVFQEYE